jgi:thiaminase
LAETPERQAVFHGLIGGVMEELKLHGGLCEEWGADVTDSTLTPSPACRAYCDFLAHQRQHATSIAEIAAAMVPCMRLYAHLGQRFVAKGTPAATYAKWFDEYSSDEFEQLSKSLEAVLDEDIGTAGASMRSLEAVQTNYTRAMELERDFFAQHASRL